MELMELMLGARGAPSDVEKTIAKDLSTVFEPLLQNEQNPITLSRLRGQASYLSHSIARAMTIDQPCIMVDTPLIQSVADILIANEFTVYMDPETRQAIVFMIGVNGDDYIVKDKTNKMTRFGCRVLATGVATDLAAAAGGGGGGKNVD